MFFYKNVKFPRIMILLLLVCTTTAYAQNGRITVNNRNMSVGEIIKTIERQTDYKLSYNRNIYDTTRVLNLPATTLYLNQVLESMVKDTDVKYMVRGQYIAFVPSNNNSRPQVRNQPELRISDRYVKNHPNDLNAFPIRRPASERTEQISPVAVIDTEAEKEQYSDYHPIDIYNNVQTSLPRFALKVNLLYGLSTLTPNISAEVALSKRSTLELSYSNNPWKYAADLDDNKKLLHGIVSLEYRYWLCERFSGHFFGIHGLYSEYNVSGHNIPILFKKDYRYRGYAWGGGVLYGYALPIGKMWNIEFTVGADVLRMDYDRYSCRTCDTNNEPFKKTHIVPSAGINLVFLIK